MATEVQSLRKEVDKLRDQVEAEKVKVAVAQTAGNDEVRAAVLRTEKDRLQTELDVLRERSNKAAVKDATKDLVEQVKEGGGASAEVKRGDS
jgi:hypothetical protein